VVGVKSRQVRCRMWRKHNKLYKNFIKKMEYTGTDRFSSLIICITNCWLRKSLYCRPISEWNSKIIINVTDDGDWRLACGVNEVWSVEIVGVCGEKLAVQSAWEKWAFNFNQLCWEKLVLTPTIALFHNLCLVMFAFTFCLESKNKHLLDKTHWDSVTWYYLYCLLHSSYMFRHYYLTIFRELIPKFL
jgi:hypothetical protein